MLTNKYHMSTIIAIFLALGIGILMGGTLGQTFVYQTEDRIVDILMTKYENQLSTNHLLQKQISSLQLMNQTTTIPILHNQKVMWVRPKEAKNDLLAFIIKSAGAEWTEKDLELETDSNQLSLSSDTEPLGQDVILISEQLQPWTEGFNTGNSKVISINSETLLFNEPKEAVDFILYIKKMLEEDSHAAIGIYHYPGLE